MIQLKNLTKKFGDFVAVDKINFEVKKGEIFGFLGPNGAGKTTTLSMLSTLLPPTSGTAFLNGFNITKNQNEVRKSIGMVFQDSTLEENLTAYENMDFHARLYSVPKEIKEKQIKKLLELVELKEKKNILVKNFSGGMKRRLEIARAFLHAPKILFLDEPTLGLDPQTRNKIWNYIKKLNQEMKMTIILTTHYMDEAERLCGNVAIIDHGKIISIGKPSELKRKIGGELITIISNNNSKLKSVLSKTPWCKSLTEHNGSLTLNVKNSEERIVDIVKISEKQKLTIKSMTLSKPSLEDVFLYFTGRTIREEESSQLDKLRIRRKLRRK